MTKDNKTEQNFSARSFGIHRSYIILIGILQNCVACKVFFIWISETMLTLFNASR